MSAEPGSRFRIFKRGCWLPEQINHSWLPEKTTLPDHPAFEAYWAERKRRTPGIFDGSLAALNAIHARSDSITLELFASSYRDLLVRCAAARKEFDGDVPDAGKPRALGISAVVSTADDLIPLILRSSEVGEYPDMLDVIGGHVDPNLHLNAQGIPDTLVAIRDEVESELGVPEAACAELSCIALLENSETSKPELAFAARLSLSFEEVSRSSTTAREKDEYVELLKIPNTIEGVARFLSNRALACTPSAHGCLAAYLEFLKTEQL